jgi:hypothetical protein
MFEEVHVEEFHAGRLPGKGGNGWDCKANVRVDWRHGDCAIASSLFDLFYICIPRIAKSGYGSLILVTRPLAPVFRAQPYRPYRNKAVHLPDPLFKRIYVSPKGLSFLLST